MASNKMIITVEIIDRSYLLKMFNRWQEDFFIKLSDFSELESVLNTNNIPLEDE